MTGLPNPADVLDNAIRKSKRSSVSPDAPADVNLVVVGDPAPEVVSRTTEGYEGPEAGDLGRLAAAAAVTEDDSCLHYPEPDFSVAGPWLVVEPLGGVVSTVHCGTGRVDVVVSYDTASTQAIEQLHWQISEVLEAARPAHDYYPVSEDEEGVFTRGMTTFLLDRIETAVDSATITLKVSTTPATTAETVESRFETIDGVLDVTYTSTVGVERATPSPEFRTAVEQAHRTVVGECGYEWYPEPTVFSFIPGGEKVALGTGKPASTTFTDAEYEQCVNLLSRCLEGVSV